MEDKKIKLKYVPWGGVLGFLIASWLGPKLIALLFTPPVSFGLQCEPVGRWSMNQLIKTQLMGFVGGIILTFFFLKWLQDWKKESPTGDKK